MMTVGENIKRIRKELGITQDELAVRCGYSHRSSINKIETGQAGVPDDKILLFASALHVTPDFLFYGDQDEEMTVEMNLLNEDSKKRLLSYYRFLLGEQDKDK